MPLVAGSSASSCDPARLAIVFTMAGFVVVAAMISFIAFGMTSGFALVLSDRRIFCTAFWAAVRDILSPEALTIWPAICVTSILAPFSALITAC